MASHRSTDRFERLGAGPVMPRTTAGLIAPEMRQAAPPPTRVVRIAPPRDPAVPICKDGLGDTGDIYEREVGHGDGDGDGDADPVAVGDGVGHRHGAGPRG
jgi:hypothetical protein